MDNMKKISGIYTKVSQEFYRGMSELKKEMPYAWLVEITKERVNFCHRFTGRVLGRKVLLRASIDPTTLLVKGSTLSFHGYAMRLDESSTMHNVQLWLNIDEYKIIKELTHDEYRNLL